MAIHLIKYIKNNDIYNLFKIIINLFLSVLQALLAVKYAKSELMLVVK